MVVLRLAAAVRWAAAEEALLPSPTSLGDPYGTYAQRTDGPCPGDRLACVEAADTPRAGATETATVVA